MAATSSGRPSVCAQDEGPESAEADRASGAERAESAAEEGALLNSCSIEAVADTD